MSKQTACHITGDGRLHMMMPSDSHFLTNQLVDGTRWPQEWQLVLAKYAGTGGIYKLPSTIDERRIQWLGSWIKFFHS